MVSHLQPVTGFGVSPCAATAARPVATVRRRSQPVVAQLESSGSNEPVNVARDALMMRTVEQQISAFGAVHAQAPQRYLVQQWSEFLEKARTQHGGDGQLISFLGDLWRSEPAEIFMPRRAFRGLSPGNPYAQSETQGTYEEVRPTEVAIRLISCREQLAVDWLELMPSLVDQKTATSYDGVVSPTNGTATSIPSSAAASNLTTAAGVVATGDKQLLLGIATKVATHQMLRDMACRPSCRHLHAWLESFMLVQHAADLTAKGSVERLHADLVNQPLCIRGGAIVDPLDISFEIFQRSTEVLEHIEQDLHFAPAHVVPITASYFESCLLL